MRRRTDGFTLVELMVVVLVIGILVAVAVPVFNAANAKAKQNSCQANQRTWAGAVEQIKASNVEPGVTTSSYRQLASGGSVWYAVANGSYLKSMPRCPSADGTSYWVYDTQIGAAGNGALIACGGRSESDMASTSGHPLYARPIAAHRYWRILATGTSWTYYPTYGEGCQIMYRISFYAASNGLSPDLCPSKAAQANSSEPGLDAGRANDSSSDTEWFTAFGQPKGAWWGVDLGAGAASEVHAVGLTTNSNYYARSYALQWSEDEAASFADKTWHTQSTFVTVGTPNLSGALFTGL